MILLDTHIWIWWVDNPKHLTDQQVSIIQENEEKGLLLSRISVWEVAKLVEKGRLRFSVPIAQWITLATQYPGIQLVELTNEIIVESTQLPGDFHKDPADQLIVATSRVEKIPLLTADDKIINYEHVEIY